MVWADLRHFVLWAVVCDVGCLYYYFFFFYFVEYLAYGYHNHIVRKSLKEAFQNISVYGRYLVVWDKRTWHFYYVPCQRARSSQSANLARSGQLPPRERKKK